MKAVILHNYGDVSQLSLESDEDLPEVGENEVRVRLRATSVNPIDWKLRSGVMKDAYPLDLPEILGTDLCGEVDEVGPGVDEWKPGDRVMAKAGGTYAEYTTAKADVLAPIPDALSFEQAAALPLVLTTGAQLIERALKIEAGETVLVTGAAGSVGRTAVYVAKIKGAKVIAGVKGSQKEEALKLGADLVVALDVPAEMQHIHDLDAVADCVGGVTAEQATKAIRDNGRFVSVAGPPSGPTERGITSSFYSAVPDASRLARLALDVANGKLEIPVVKTFPLEQIQEATRMAEKGGAGGKVVVTIA